MVKFSALCTGVLISPQPDQEGKKLGSMSGTRGISKTSRRELSSRFFFFFFLQGKAPKEIHAILIETLACLHLCVVSAVLTPEK